MSQRNIKQLLDSVFKTYHIEYHSYFSNHLSQGLIALHQLGANDKRLNEYYRQHIRKKLWWSRERAIPPEQTIDESNWKKYIGETKFFVDYLTFFKSQISKYGRQKTISKYVPQLAGGEASAAFHPIIQLGYGIEIESDEVISEGLAYLCYRYQRFFDQKFDETDTTNSFDLQFILNSLKTLQESKEITNFIQEKINEPSDAFHEKMDLVSKKICELSKNQLGDQINQNTMTIDFPLHLNEKDLNNAMNRLVLSAIYVFYSTGMNDFFLLHGITSSQAGKMIFGQLDSPQDKSQFIRHLWRGLFTTYICQGLPVLKPPSTISYQIENEEERWKQVIQKGLQSNEEHITKVIFACKKENDHYHEQDEENKKLFPKQLLLLTCEGLIKSSGINGEHFRNGVGIFNNPLQENLFLSLFKKIFGTKKKK